MSTSSSDQRPLLTCLPDLSLRPLFIVEQRHMRASPSILYRAWTKSFDQWFADPGTVMMRDEVNAPFFFETRFEGARHPHYGRFLRLDPNHLVEMSWVTAATRGAETVVTVTLEPQDTGTHLLLRHAGFPDDESSRRHGNAWQQVLNDLDHKITRSVE